MAARPFNFQTQHAALSRRQFFLLGGVVILLTQFSRTLSAGEIKQFAVTISHGQVAKKFRTLRVTEGDMVEITFTSDESSELHLHGINVLTHLTAGKPATMSFRAQPAGRFPIEAHGAGARGGLLYVEVHPK